MEISLMPLSVRELLEIELRSDRPTTADVLRLVGEVRRCWSLATGATRVEVVANGVDSVGRTHLDWRTCRDPVDDAYKAYLEGK